jgi:polysaccharide export outer membrane protein
LLGLWAVGCQSSPTLGRNKPAPTRTGTAVAARQPTSQRAVQLLRPRELSGGVRTAAAVSLQAPVVRAFGTDSSVVTPSSWRPLQRGPDLYIPPEPVPVTTPGLAMVPDHPGVAAPPLEHLAMPRPLPNGTLAPPHATVVAYPHGPGPGVPVEGHKAALPPYRIEPPDILLIQLYRSGEKVPQPVDGSHLIRPDGTVNLGTYGSVRLGGLTLEEARATVTRFLSERINDLKLEEVNVDVISYNSKFYYVITDGAGYGQQVYRLPITGSETVLDAIGQIGGLPPVASLKKIWVARPNLGHPHTHEILPVNWLAIAKCGSTATNYQIAPGDRVFVQSNALITTDSRLSQAISPIQRLLGVTLLGSATVNSIRGRGAFGGAGTGTGTGR